MAQIQWLGQVAPLGANTQAWEEYIRAICDNMNGAWLRATSARATLKSVRERLGMPFMSQPGEGAAPGAWDAGLEQNYIELGSMVATLTRFANDALEGKRKLGVDQSGDFGFERLPSDLSRVEVQTVGGRPRPVEIENATGQPLRVTGTVGALPAIVVSLGIVAVAVTVYFVVEQVCETVENVAEQKTFETISNNQVKQIEAGATPEQAKALTDSIYEGAVTVHEARAAEAAAGRSEIPQTIRTVGFIALGLAAVYLAIRLLGRGGGAAALSPARMLLNPVRRSGDVKVNIRYRDKYEDYAGVVTWPGGRWPFEFLRPPRSGVAGGPPVPGLDIAVDSPRAYDVMAATALSFASYEKDDIFSYADYDPDRDQFVIRRR